MGQEKRERRGRTKGSEENYGREGEHKGRVRERMRNMIPFFSISLFYLDL